MKKLVFFMMGAFISAAWSGSAMAQSQCSDVLKDGVFQTSNYRERNYFNQIIWSRFMKSTFETASSDTSLGFGVPVGEIVLGGKFTRAEYDAKKASISNEYFNKISSSNELDIALTSGDPIILEKWSDCMQKQGGGLTIRFDPISSRQAFVNLQYYPQGTRNRVRLSRNVVLPQGVSLVDGGKCFRRGTRIVAGNVCRARIEIDQAQRPVPLVVNANEASAQAFLPARVVLATQRRPLEQARLPNLNTHAWRAVYEPSHTARLTAEEVGLGWRFEPKTAQALLTRTQQSHWANNCWMKHAIATFETFSYAFVIEGKSKKGDRARNGSVTCHVDASIMMTRDVWVPQKDEVPVEQLIADAGANAPTMAAALSSLSGSGNKQLPSTTLAAAQADLNESALQGMAQPTRPEDLTGVVSLWHQSPR